MLIEYSVGNFRSFHDQATLSLLASKLTSANEELDRTNLVVALDDVPLVRSAAIFGANASGKSNLVRALGFLREFVLGSSKEGQVGESIGVEPFKLSSTTRHAPSHFEIVFVAGGVQYRYGFECTTEKVHKEWLYYLPSRRETALFERQGDTIEVNRSAFGEGSELKDKTRSNALFLSVCAQFNGKVSTALLKWFQGLQVVSGGIISSSYTAKQLSGGEHATAIVEMVKSLDLGIRDLSAEFRDWDAPQSSALTKLTKMFTPEAMTRFKIGKTAVVTTKHAVYDDDGAIVGEESFDLNGNESNGTRKLFAMIGRLLDSLNTGEVVVIDEMETSLHPMLTRALVHLFHDPAVNRWNAQLVFTTHDLHLLSEDLMRRDQIWFTEKDERGATTLYSLAEIKTRKDARFAKEYLQGRYGAVPFLGQLQDFGARVSK